MKKVYNFLALAILFIAGVTAAQAEDRYLIIDEEDNWSADEIEEGYDFVINNGYLGGGTYDLIAGTSKTSYISEENFYQVEATGETDEGYVKYKLIHTSTGEYLAHSSGEIYYTTTSSRAWEFCIKEAVVYDEDDIEDELVDDYTSATATTPYGNGVIFVDATATYESEYGDFYYLCTNGEGSTPYLGTSYYTNCLLIYNVETQLIQLTGADYLSQMLSETITSEPSEMYNVGDEPGNISQELMDELQAAYDACYELINEYSTDHEACVEAYERLVAALEAAYNGRILVEEGYYWFSSARSDLNATYDDGSQLCWTYEEDWDYPEYEDMVASDLKYVWELIEDETEYGSYYIRNVYTQRYIGCAFARATYVPTTEDPEYNYYIYPQDKDDFVIEAACLIDSPLEDYSGNYTLTALHCASDYNGVVIWTTEADASGWTFIICDADVVESLLSAVEQDQLNEELQELVAEALAEYETGFSYTIDGYNDGHLDVDESGNPTGLVTSIDQVSTNSLETAEGSLEALLDCIIGSSDNSDNFYHSIWDSDTADEAGYDCTEVYPYLQFDLEQAVSDIKVKMWSRYNGSSYLTSNLPGNFNVLVTSTPDDEDSWTEVSTAAVVLAWPHYDVDEDGNEEEYSSNTVAYADIHFGDDYQYVRLEVTNRYGSTTDFKNTTIAYACYNMSEIRVFEEYYDEETSMIEAVPEDVLTAFLEAVEVAQANIEAETVTQEVIDAFQEAYDLFLANFPDPDKVTDALDDALTFYETGSEGTTIGTYEEGALAEFYAALEAVEGDIKSIMTMDEVNACLDAIEEALATLTSKLNVPEADTYYRIVSRTTDDAADSYVLCSGNGATVNSWIASSEENADWRLGTYWKLISNEDGTYSLQSALTGEYLDTPRDGSSIDVGMSTEGDTCTFTFRHARAETYFNLVFEEDVYLNAEATGDMVTWTSGEGTDNSCFEFITADTDAWDGALAWDAVDDGYTIITLPLTIESDGSCYSVIGLDSDSYLQLEQIAKRTEIEGGTPFFYYGEGNDGVPYFDCIDGEFDALNYATEAQTVNGLVGTFAPIEELAVGYGILYNNTAIVPSEEGEGVETNSGYILPSVPTTDETGDMSILVDGTLTSISTAAVSTESAASIVNVYTLSGTLVRTNVKNANATNGLPAGIYIVGKQKVLVK